MLVNNLQAAALPAMVVILNLGLGMDPVLVGIIGFAPRIFDAVSDPMMGYISDNTRSRWGRRRPYIFGGATLGRAGLCRHVAASGRSLGELLFLDFFDRVDPLFFYLHGLRHSVCCFRLRDDARLSRTDAIAGVRQYGRTTRLAGSALVLRHHGQRPV